MNRWGWLLQHAVGIGVALLLGAILSGVRFFQRTSLMGTELTAAELVQFLAYGLALVLVWTGAQTAVAQLGRAERALRFVREIAVPVATLIVVASAYQVLLLVLLPFLPIDALAIYRWVFVIAIIAAAAWTGFACYRNAGLLFEGAIRSRGMQLTDLVSCPRCGADIAPAARFCSKCGSERPASAPVAAGTVCTCGAELAAGARFCGQCGKERAS